MADEILKGRIEEAVEKQREQIVNALTAILKFKTISGATDEAGINNFRTETARCMEFLEQEAQRLGFEWQNRDNAFSYIHMPGGESFVGLPVHIDVVPAGEGWKHDPFSGTIMENTIYGRGCQDDKGPVIQMIYAMCTLKQLGLNLKRGARVIVGTQEECGDWADIAQYKSEETMPELSIIPDAVFPIINGEKGMLNLQVKLEFAEDEEPNVGGFRFAHAMAGERANMVPARAELLFSGDAESDIAQLSRELERFLRQYPEVRAEIRRGADGPHSHAIIFHGKSAHGSTPEDGHNAALDLLLYMTQSGFVSDDEADLAQFLYDAGSDYSGARLGIEAKHDFVGPTSLNLGILKWTGASATLVFNIRNTLGTSVEQTIANAREKLNDFAAETGFSVEAGNVGKTMEPIFVDPERHPDFIGALSEAYTTFTGREATRHAIGGTTYAKVFPNAVCFGPVDLNDEKELAHQTDERIHIDHLLRNVKIYAYALAKLCGA